MHRVAAKFAPRLMTDDLKANRVLVCQELIDRIDEDESFLSRITSTQNFTAIRCSFRLFILQSDKRKNTHYLKQCSFSKNEDICDRKTAFKSANLYESNDTKQILLKSTRAVNSSSTRIF